MKDRFDRLTWLACAVTLIALCFFLLQDGGREKGASSAATLDKGVQREMMYQARSAFLQKVYGPVAALQQEGKLQTALLKLEEIHREYPGEAHGYILKGAILNELGALDEAIRNYREGIRLNGDYVDEKSPLSRRTEIRQLVVRGKDIIGTKAKADAGNPTYAESLRNVYYLESRLSGGCE